MSATLPVLTTRLLPAAFPVALPADRLPTAAGLPTAVALPQAVNDAPGAAADGPALPGAPPLDLEPVRQALLREAGARGQHVDIDQTLTDLLDGEFRDARVLNYLPIFLLRAARSRLGLGQR